MFTSRAAPVPAPVVRNTDSITERVSVGGAAGAEANGTAVAGGKATAAVTGSGSAAAIVTAKATGKTSLTFADALDAAKGVKSFNDQGGATDSAEFGEKASIRVISAVKADGELTGTGTGDAFVVTGE